MADEIAEAASSLFDEMLRDLVQSITISAHREIKRGRVVCGVCGTKCRSHNPLSSTHLTAPSSQTTAPASRAPSPLPSSSSNTSGTLEGRSGGYTTGPEKGTGGSTGIGSGSGRMDASGNVFFACLVCDRQVVSSRYAPHLSGCLGFNGSTRRTASRSAATAAAAAAKARLGPGSERGVSPYVPSEGGDSDDGSPGGSLGKKGKMLSGNGGTKRGPSPKKPGPMKKARMGSSGGTPSPLPRTTLPPSKLGRPPTTNSAADPSVSYGSPSPGRSVASLADSGGRGYTTLSKTAGRKTLPGMSVSGDLHVAYVPDDDSDGEVDDY
ncbi:uncharacterized protein MKK02DRAFT_40380 [Dioszegia hungarica]|uniref:SAGA-associated factor 11 n=1 Tax=Dioszegia hungarica TaxID=4972 RepID=A0AA38LRG8_9TREE|nr:uncharacterized protein MKK02DRAFT_40380 [Dioszegia hungarica]KAI9633000.1 hypothetical protein MKK02DRAFT_40380 [Dioszegia hungarica]